MRSECLIDGCVLPATQRGWCPKHYQRWRRHGDTGAVLIAAFEDSLWSRVLRKLDHTDDPDACWEFTGSHPGRGYGVIRYHGATQYAHRIAFETQVRPLLPGEFVCHRCDNPPCCNWSHLFAGSSAVNVADMWAKGRGKVPAPVSGVAWYRRHPRVARKGAA